jgi:hypothetical protein
MEARWRDRERWRWRSTSTGMVARARARWNDEVVKWIRALSLACTLVVEKLAGSEIER